MIKAYASIISHPAYPGVSQLVTSDKGERGLGFQRLCVEYDDALETFSLVMKHSGKTEKLEKLSFGS